MKYFSILIPFVLSGCVYQSVNQNDIQTSIKVCGSLEQIVEINAHWNGTEKVMCANRKETYLDERSAAK